MKLIEQVTNLELSKKLKSLNVKQESLYRWQNPFFDDHWEPTALKKEYIEKNNTNPENYAAFSVAELGQLLPSDISYGYKDLFLNMDKSDNIFIVSYDEICSGEHVESFFKSSDTSEADARAKTLICLIQNELIKKTE